MLFGGAASLPLAATTLPPFGYRPPRWRCVASRWSRWMTYPFFPARRREPTCQAKSAARGAAACPSAALEDATPSRSAAVARVDAWSSSSTPPETARKGSRQLRQPPPRPPACCSCRVVVLAVPFYPAGACSCCPCPFVCLWYSFRHSFSFGFLYCALRALPVGILAVQRQHHPRRFGPVRLRGPPGTGSRFRPRTAALVVADAP
mmetsp:Transcript_10319/g.25365  ORF Transcript_10319/g.25365 Transcript_10319/m.25365 type:complete len:205 (+) Transcript_10319:2725-3339(+)